MKKTLLAGLASGLLVLGISGMANASSASFDVYAYNHSANGGSSNGLDTGFAITAGDSLAISVDANQIWSAGPYPRNSNANGLDANSVGVGGADFGFYSADGSSFHYGALIGRIGDSGSRFLVGTNYAGTATESGELHLMYWDANNSDNSGYVTAHVNASHPTPEPATLLLLGSGLAGLIGTRRQKQRQA